MPARQRPATCPPAACLPWHIAARAAAPGEGAHGGAGGCPYLALALQRPLHLRHLPPLPQPARGGRQRGSVPRRHRPAVGRVEQSAGVGGEPGQGHPPPWRGRGISGTAAACQGLARSTIPPPPRSHSSLLPSPLPRVAAGALLRGDGVGAPRPRAGQHVGTQCPGISARGQEGTQP